MEIKEQIKQKFETDPTFAAALKEARNGEEAMKALQAAGFQLTEEEFKGMCKADCAAVSDDELDKVSGGISVSMGEDGKWHYDWHFSMTPEED